LDPLIAGPYDCAKELSEEHGVEVEVIDPPDPMILSVGRVSDRVIPFKGEMNIKSMCCLTLSIDHRVLDGVLGSRFLMRVKDHLENPVEIQESDVDEMH
jgi:pyruvate/2-oxoglutarate dehydrogenase complex dihydrolipoamide acyltransferase (E2) component